VSDRLWAVALAALAKDPDSRPLAGELASRLRAAVRVNHEGTTVRLPVNPNHGTVVLPALPADLKIAARAHAAPHAVWPARAAQAQDGALARQIEPAPTPPQIAPASQQSAQVVPINRAAQAAQMAAPTTPIARTPAAPPAAQPSPTPQQNPQRSAPPNPYTAQAPQRAPGQASSPQVNHYPMAYQNPPRSVSQGQPQGQYGPPQQQYPRQQTYQAPRSQAPRQPQTYSASGPERTGLSCLSKLAILVIVLAIAVAIGVTVGKQLAKQHNTSNGSLGSITQMHSVSQGHSHPSAPVALDN
jgi:serine/threonine-protein kinase